MTASAVQPSYTIQPDDTLASIARKFYNNPDRWQDLYQANRQAIGANPDQLRSGIQIVVPNSKAKVYLVRAGDSLASIAKQFYEDADRWRKIYEVNQTVIGPNPTELHPGTQLVIPARPRATHRVDQGDTLSSIAQQFYNDKSRWREIYEANRDVIGNDPALLTTDTELVIP